MASTYLSRTFSTGNRKKWTFSAWVKRSGVSGDMELFGRADGTDNGSSEFFILSDGRLGFGRWNDYILRTTRKLRDGSGWYHLVLRVDTTLSTADDRARIYINGVQETDFEARTNMAQNYDFAINSNVAHLIGGIDYSGTVQRYMNGLMSHVHFCDGYSYDASAFGSTDSTTGEWKINTSPSVSYGTTGFTILKDGMTITDQSANSNNWTLGGGTLTKTEDNPSNVFATINALDNYRFGGTFTNGNNRVVSVSSVESYWTSTLGASSGKYYWEVKIDSSGSGKDFVGIADKVAGATDFTPYSGNNKMRSYYGSTGVSVVGSTGTAFGATFGTGDIIGVAMDLDNHKIYYSKNGAWQGSGNPTTGANGLAIDTSPASGFYYAQAANIHNTASTFKTNFGNGYFGTDAVSSAGSNASGIGIFEYDVPTGFTALSTKGLNE